MSRRTRERVLFWMNINALVCGALAVTLTFLPNGWWPL